MIAARPYSFTRRQLQCMGLESAPAITTLRPVHLPAAKPAHPGDHKAPFAVTLPEQPAEPKPAESVAPYLSLRWYEVTDLIAALFAYWDWQLTNGFTESMRDFRHALSAEMHAIWDADNPLWTPPQVDEWFATESRITPDPVGEVAVDVAPVATIKPQSENAKAAWLHRLWTLKHAAIKSYGRCSPVARQAALNFDEYYARQHGQGGEL